MKFPLHLRDAAALFEVIYEHRGTWFIRLPRDILRWVLAPMLLGPYRIVAKSGYETMIGLGIQRFIDGDAVGPHWTGFLTGTFGYFVEMQKSGYMLGRVDKFGSKLEDVGNIVPADKLLFGRRRGPMVITTMYATVPWRCADVPIRHHFRVDNVPEKYGTVVACQFFSGRVHIILWDGNRGLVGRAFDDPDYCDKWIPHLVTPEWKIRLPYVPVCFDRTADPMRLDVVYPWGEVETIRLGFEYE